MVTLGNVLLALAFLAAIASVGALLWGDRLGNKEGARITNLGYQITFAVLGALAIAVLMLMGAFFAKDFSFQYVAENHSTDVSGLAWLYTISALWAGREGSLLFWAFLLACYAAWIAYRRISHADRLSNMGLMVTNVVQVLFLAGLLFSQPNNPFKATPAEWLDQSGKLLVAVGMNPLLQHWAMILHPPTLFIGYAGMTLPFAFAVAAIICNDGSSDWIDLIGRETVFAFLFLGAGIGLGSVWAYVVLGWGGYWAWDPVENASLLPWLTGVGLLHSFTVYRRRGAFKKWSIGLAGYTFALVILGTFITRSGIVQSVHAFEKDPFSLWLFLGMIVGALAVTLGGVLMRGKTFEGADEFESLTSKEAAYYINNVIMTVAGTLVAYLTVTSALPSWMPGGGQSFTAATYDAVARPVGVLYALVIALCPLLAWGKTEGGKLFERIKWPLVSTAVLSALLLTEWWTNLRPIFAAQKPNASAVASAVHNGEAVVGLIVASLLISTTMWLFIDGARKRAAARDESFGAALWSVLSKARTQSGGYLTHLGVGIVLIGLVGSAMFVRDVKVQLPTKPGATKSAAGYTFKFVDIRQTELRNGDLNTQARIELLKGDKLVGTLRPGQLSYAQQDQTRLNASVVSEPLKDIFVSLEGADDKNVQLAVKLNPLIWFTWVGFILMLVGTGVALWPKRGAQPVVISGGKSSAKKPSVVR
jgi:cytochrome c-type biogenesis protein CcmF